MSTSEATEPKHPPLSAGSDFQRLAGAYLAPGLIVLAAVAAYAGSLRGPFVLDDFTSIKDNPTIRHLWPIWQALSPPEGEGLTPNGRPLVNLSLALNYAISGTETWSYHLFNLTVHILAGLALLGAARRTLLGTLSASASRGSVVARSLALTIALIWVVHPLQTESVTYIVQRAESMMGMFYLFTLYAFIRYAEAPSEGAERIHRWCWGAAAIVSCAAGMGSKEVTVSAPLMVVFYDRTFLSGTFSESWRRHRAVFAGLAATWLILAYEVAITGDRGGTAGYGSNVVWWRYSLTQFPAIIHYLRLCFWPHRLVFDYGMGLAMQKVNVVPYAAAVAALLAAVALALYWRPKLGFLGVWFFAVLAPTSSVVPVATQTMAEHRMYLPLAAVSAVVVLALYELLEFARPARPRAAAQSVFITGLALAAGLGFMTLRRNQVYRSNLALWSDTVESYPKNMRALYNLGCSLTELGRTEEAVADFATVVKIQPDYIDAHQNLANGLVKLGRVEESMIHYEIAARAHPESADIQCSLGIALLDTDRVEAAIKHLRQAHLLKPGLAEATYQLGEALLRDRRAAEALPLLEAAARSRPEDAHVQNALGNALLQVDRLPDALTAYRTALRIDHEFAEAHNNLGSVFLQLGKTKESVPEFKAALRLKPDFGEAHNNLGDALLEAGLTEEAVVEFQAAVRLKTDSADTQYNLANSLAKLGRRDQAAENYRQVIAIRPDFAEAHNNFGIVLAQLGRLKEARDEFAQAVRLKPDLPGARENLSQTAEALRPDP